MTSSDPRTATLAAFSLNSDSDYSHQGSIPMWVMGLGLGLWEKLRVTPAALTMTPIIARARSTGNLSYGYRNGHFLCVCLPVRRDPGPVRRSERLPAGSACPFIPAAIFGELLCSDWPFESQPHQLPLPVSCWRERSGFSMVTGSLDDLLLENVLRYVRAPANWERPRLDRCFQVLRGAPGTWLTC